MQVITKGDVMKKQSGKKLVEILAVELKDWPEDGGPVDAVVQDPDRIAYVRKKYDPDVFAFHGNEWIGVWYNHAMHRPLSDLATDYATAIVTRDQWEAERANLEGEKVMRACAEKCEPESKTKANAQAWIRHRGRKNPFDVCTLVDARLRSGDVVTGKFSDNLKFVHTGSALDVMAYRVNESVDSEAQEVTAPNDGPLQWRDRITEIDREVESLEEERASLIQKLADEGFKLIKREAVERVERIEEWQRLAMINGRKVEAVREYRAKHGSSLRDSVIAIDNYREDNGYAGS
jgi:hypothetical protein